MDLPNYQQLIELYKNAILDYLSHITNNIHGRSPTGRYYVGLNPSLIKGIISAYYIALGIGETNNQKLFFGCFALVSPSRDGTQIRIIGPRRTYDAFLTIPPESVTFGELDKIYLEALTTSLYDSMIKKELND